MESKREPLDQAELQAMNTLHPQLQDHARLTEEAFNLIGEVLGWIPETRLNDVSQSRKVLTAFLVRLSNDLRAAALLAMRGYPVQAAGVVASMYEVAYSIAYIRSDDTLAQRWIDHDDPTRPFCQVRQMTEEVLRKLGVQDANEQIGAQYRVYRQLCMAKHTNPLFQRQHGYQLQRGRIVAVNGPDTTESAIRAAWFAPEQAARLTFLAVAAYVDSHIPIHSRGDLRSKIDAIGLGSNKLATKAAQRFGTEDPFPGKW